MSKPLSLLIADELEQAHPHEAAAELRRQHALIGELVKALTLMDTRLRECSAHPIWVSDAYDSFYQSEVAAVLLSAKEQQ